jgi:hypothetical protein
MRIQDHPLLGDFHTAALVSCDDSPGADEIVAGHTPSVAS